MEPRPTVDEHGTDDAAEAADKPALSVIILTRNEEGNVADAVGSLLAQDARDLEVIVVDSASTDATLEEARAFADVDDRVRIVASPVDISIGEARNRGIATARGNAVAFMSADAWAEPGWARAAVDALRDAEIVYGRQRHAPPRATVAAIVRGLRYHHFDHDADLPPDTFASNVNAAIRRDVFAHLEYVSDGPGSALDDILFTREAQDLGLRVAYAPDMLVHHKDASTLRTEYAKNKREGYAWGLLSPRLGMHPPALAWGASLVALAAAALVWPSVLTAILLGFALWAPTLRRVGRAGRAFLKSAPQLAAAAIVGPLFDLAFLTHYARGLLARRHDLTGLKSRPKEA